MTNFTASFRTLTTAAALIAGGVAVPAFAANGAAAAATDAGFTATATNAVDDAKRTYCVNATPSGDPTVTGSYLQRKVCKTKAQWTALGATFVRK